MDPGKWSLLKVLAPPEELAKTSELVESLMDRRPELRFQFIQERALRRGTRHLIGPALPRTVTRSGSAVVVERVVQMVDEARRG